MLNINYYALHRCARYCPYQALYIKVAFSCSQFVLHERPAYRRVTSKRNNFLLKEAVDERGIRLEVCSVKPWKAERK